VRVLPGVLDAEACAWLLNLDEPTDSLSFTSVPEDLPDLSGLLAQVEAVGSSWGLPRRSWRCSLASYPPSSSFPLHADYDPGRGPDFWCHTYSASVLLSDPDAFEGGDLLVDGLTMPRQRGGPVIFDAFTPHEVLEVRSGRRVSLVVFAVYGTNAQAEADGWPLCAWTGAARTVWPQPTHHRARLPHALPREGQGPGPAPHRDVSQSATWTSPWPAKASCSASSDAQQKRRGKAPAQRGLGALPTAPIHQRLLHGLSNR
jgi:hypothetical protein